MRHLVALVTTPTYVLSDCNLKVMWREDKDTFKKEVRRIVRR